MNVKCRFGLLCFQGACIGMQVSLIHILTSHHSPLTSHITRIRHHVSPHHTSHLTTSFQFRHYITHIPHHITHVSHHTWRHHTADFANIRQYWRASLTFDHVTTYIIHILRQTSLASDITCYHRVTTSFITCHHVIHLHTLHRSHPTSHHPHPTSHFTTSDITSHITHGTQLDSLERSGPRQRLQAPLKTSIAHRKFT